MKKYLSFLVISLFMTTDLAAQIEPAAGTWKTWFISSGKDYRLPPPSSAKDEIAEVLSKQSKIDDAAMQQIIYWNTGAPGYRWQEMIDKLWMYDTTYSGSLAYMLLGVAIYDATIAAWDTKYVYNRSRPFAADSRIKLLVTKPESSSYPCEHSVAAGVAVTIISHFYPAFADSVSRMANKLMDSRIVAGVAFPGDTRAGFTMGKKIALEEIERTKDFANKTAWDGKIPKGTSYWNGKFALLPLAGNNKTVVLDSGSQLRPQAPPDFAEDMKELKNFKANFRSNANAFYWASQDFWSEAFTKKIFEHNLHLNPPRAALLYAISALTTYDCFISCFDAKYAYWGIRPDQYDTSYHSLVPTPPFPGYPSGHAMMSGMYGELFSSFFPEAGEYFRKKAKDAAESRFQAGIHFRTDNEVGLQLGKKLTDVIIQKMKEKGFGKELQLATSAFP